MASRAVRSLAISSWALRAISLSRSEPVASWSTRWVVRVTSDLRPVTSRSRRWVPERAVSAASAVEARRFSISVAMSRRAAARRLVSAVSRSAMRPVIWASCGIGPAPLGSDSAAAASAERRSSMRAIRSASLPAPVRWASWLLSALASASRRIWPSPRLCTAGVIVFSVPMPSSMAARRLASSGEMTGCAAFCVACSSAARRLASSGEGFDVSDCMPGMNGAASRTSTAPTIPAIACEAKRPNADGPDGGGGAAAAGLAPALAVAAGFPGSDFFESAATDAPAAATFSAAARCSVPGFDPGVEPAAAPAVAPVREAVGSGFTSTALPSIVACGRFGPGPSLVLLIDTRPSSYARRLPAKHRTGPRRKTCARPSRMKSPVSLDGKALVVQPATNPLDHVHERTHRRPVRHFDGDVSEG